MVLVGHACRTGVMYERMNNCCGNGATTPDTLIFCSDPAQAERPRRTRRNLRRWASACPRARPTIANACDSRSPGGREPAAIVASMFSLSDFAGARPLAAVEESIIPCSPPWPSTRRFAQRNLTLPEMNWPCCLKLKAPSRHHSTMAYRTWVRFSLTDFDLLFPPARGADCVEAANRRRR